MLLTWKTSLLQGPGGLVPRVVRHLDNLEQPPWAGPFFCGVNWSPGAPCSCLHTLLLHSQPLPAPHLSLLPSPNPFGHNPALSQAGYPWRLLSPTQSLEAGQGKAHGISKARRMPRVLTKHTSQPVLFALGVQQPSFLLQG